jgi:hypothetical protein
LGGPHAHIVGDALQPVGKIRVPNAQPADERQDGEGENDGRAFKSFELHAVGLNKKPAQLKAALVLKSEPTG